MSHTVGKSASRGLAPGRAHVVFHPHPHARALRVPEDEAAARVLLDREEVELLADLPMVAPRRLSLPVAAWREDAWVAGGSAANLLLEGLAPGVACSRWCSSSCPLDSHAVP